MWRKSKTIILAGGVMTIIFCVGVFLYLVRFPVVSPVFSTGSAQESEEVPATEPDKEREELERPDPASLAFGTVITEDPANQVVHGLFRFKSISSPKSLVFSQDGSEIWVASLLNEQNGIGVYSRATGKPQAMLTLDDGGATEVLLSKDGSKIYASQMETGRIFEIDSETKKILRIFNAGGAWTKEMALSRDGKTLFASNWSSNTVSEIDLVSGELLRTISTVDTPRGMYVTEDGSSLYIAGFGSGELERINLKSGTSTLLYRSGGAMRHIVGNERSGVLYVSDMAKAAIYKVVLGTGEVELFAETDTNPNTIALTPDGNVLIVSNRGKNYSREIYNRPGPEWGSILLFDTNTGDMLDAIVAGNQPTALDISHDGEYVAFSNFLDATIEMYQLPSYEVLRAGGGGRSAVYKSELLK